MPWQQDEHGLDLSGVPRSVAIPLLAVVYAIGLALFLAIEPTKPWILLVVVALVGLGTDGILRNHPRGQLRGFADTSPFLFVPVLLALATGLFLEEVDAVHGYRTIPAVIGAGLLLSAALYGEYVSVVSHGPSFALGRLLLNILTYVAAFLFFAVIYAYDVALLPSAFAAGLFSLLLAVEVFREAEADAYRALIFAAVIGLVVAEVRWALYFIPLEDFLASILLLVIFYQATGLIQHHLTGHLNRTIAAEFTLVTGVGLGIVIIGRVFALG
ncbi:MAG: hypothetical protein WD939_03500 [Dehalococcoidia bacterium]